MINKCHKIPRIECPFYHSAEDRRINWINFQLKQCSKDNILSNPDNKIQSCPSQGFPTQSSNINHFKELQMLKQKEQELNRIKVYNEYNQYYYNKPQTSYWQNSVGTPPMAPPEQQTMMYYPPQYTMAPQQYYSPPSTLPSYPQNEKFFPRAITGPKL